MQPTPGTGAVIAAVFDTVAQRKWAMPTKSYVAGLLRQGTSAIACKLAEETGEVIKAAREQTAEALTKELCDLLFHALVLMADKDISLFDVEMELSQRHGVSGLDNRKN